MDLLLSTMNLSPTVEGITITKDGEFAVTNTCMISKLQNVAANKEWCPQYKPELPLEEMPKLE